MGFLLKVKNDRLFFSGENMDGKTMYRSSVTRRGFGYLKFDKNQKCSPVKIAVELCRGSRGQMPVPEVSFSHRKMPSSSINCGCMVVVTAATAAVSFVVTPPFTLLLGVSRNVVYVRHLGLKLFVPQTNKDRASVLANTRM